MDSDHQADKVWLLGVQRKLYQWSRQHPDESYRELWNWIIDPRNLRCAWARVAANQAKRAAGIDGKTVGSIRRDLGEHAYLAELRIALRAGTYVPSPCRRKLIPKPRKPGQFRALGIPTVTKRVVQSAVKQILEPFLEARFRHVSYGFRPGRGCHGALEHSGMTLRPRRVSKVPLWAMLPARLTCRVRPVHCLSFTTSAYVACAEFAHRCAAQTHRSRAANA